MYGKKIAIIIQNSAQYRSLRSLLIYFKKNKIVCDIFIYKPDSIDKCYKDIGDDVEKLILHDGFKIKADSQSKYDICLSPYCDMGDIECLISVCYWYSSGTAKVYPLSPDLKMGFHAFFVHDMYSASLMDVYGKTYIVPRIYFEKIPKRSKKQKKTLLYLPTYGTTNIPKVAKSLNELKNNFYIITKVHHGIEFLDSEEAGLEEIKKVSDELYMSDKNLNDLFKKSDVVLSDNSGAIFDALYQDIPVAIASNELPDKMFGVVPLQNILIQKGIIPYTSTLSSDTIEEVLSLALNNKKKQNDYAKTLFPDRSSGVNGWIKQFRSLMNEQYIKEYIAFHDSFMNTNKNNQLEMSKLIAQKDRYQTLEQELAKYQELVAKYQNSRLHKLIDLIQLKLGRNLLFSFLAPSKTKSRNNHNN